MSRRITSKAVDKVNRIEAIQPGQRDRVIRLLTELSQILETEAAPDHKGMTVFHVSSTKEVKKEGATESSRVDHRWGTLIIIEHLPQSTAKKEVAGGGAATQTRKGDQRLVDLTFTQRLEKLLYDCFLQKLAEESGKEVAKALKWLIVATTLFLLARC
jgi:hypothetical protein